MGEGARAGKAGTIAYLDAASRWCPRRIAAQWAIPTRLVDWWTKPLESDARGLMPGPPPKDPKQRRRVNSPTRGDWIDIPEPELAEPAHPSLGKLRMAKGVAWSPELRDRWGVWTRDPSALYWTIGDLQYAVDTLRIFHDRADDLPLTEISRRLDRLGLTPTGKRTLRYRIRFAPWEEPGLEPAPDEPAAAAPNVTSIDARRSALQHGA